MAMFRCHVRGRRVPTSSSAHSVGGSPEASLAMLAVLRCVCDLDSERGHHSVGHFVGKKA